MDRFINSFSKDAVFAKRCPRARGSGCILRSGPDGVGLKVVSVRHSSVACDSRRLRSPRRARFDPFSPSVGSRRVGARPSSGSGVNAVLTWHWGNSRQNGTMGRRNNPSRSARGRPKEVRPFSLGSHWRADGAPKAVFRTQQDALRAASGSQFDTGTVLNAYQCDFCSRWHLGSSGARER